MPQSELKIYFICGNLFKTQLLTVICTNVNCNDNYFIFQSFLFLDMEGSPVQEIAAIQVKKDNYEVMDVFHGYAFTEEEDEFSRLHIHGLNKDYLKVFGHSSEASLVNVFKHWLLRTQTKEIYCNDASKERRILQIDILNFNLLPWAERMSCASHQIANRYKDYMIPVLGKFCCKVAHSSFICAPYSPNPFTRLAKVRHGFHCALYDVMELYFEKLLCEQ